ncbi:MAG: fasciclin domain-containing protein [Galbitalea sp.]
MARAEVGVALASILIVAGVLAIPLVAPSAVVTPTTIPAILPSASASAGASPASTLVGGGCAAYSAQVPSGAGSILGMSQEPLVTAASSNPDLTTFAAAVSGTFNPKVNLAAVLNGSPFTVFAPVDSAFAKLPAATLASLKLPASASTLSGILDYQVVKGELQPANVDGVLNTLQGGTLTVTGSGNAIKVTNATTNTTANVICGGIQTANATLYLIDTVLTPPK